VPTKVIATEGSPLAEWLKNQPLIVACPDPMGDEPLPTVIVPVDNTVVPNDEVTGTPDVASAPGIQATAAEAVATSTAAQTAKKK
jgi:hypothetical protein